MYLMLQFEMQAPKIYSRSNYHQGLPCVQESWIPAKRYPDVSGSSTFTGAEVSAIPLQPILPPPTLGNPQNTGFAKLLDPQLLASGTSWVSEDTENLTCVRALPGRGYFLGHSESSRLC